MNPTDKSKDELINELIQLCRQIAETETTAALRQGSSSSRLQEVQCKRFVEQAPLGMVSCDLGGKIVTVNERFAEMFRLSSSGAANFLNLLAFPPFVQAGVTSDILRCLETGDPIVSEPMFARDEGEPFFARIHISRVRSPEGYPIGAQAILEDITQRKIAESELKAKSGLINNLLQASPAYFVAVDREGKTIMMNRAMLKAIGHDPDEVVGVPFVATFVPEDERAGVSEVFKKLVDEKQATVHRNRLIATGGEEVLCEWHGRPVVRSTGDLSFFFVFGIDITAHEAAKERLAHARDELEQRVKERTAELELANQELQAEIAERHRAEEALKKTEEKFRTIFEHSLDIILITNIETGHILAANQAVRTVLQHDPQALIGKHFSTLYPPYPESPVVDSPDDFRVQGAVFEAQEILHADGTVLYMDLTATVIPWESETALLITYRDVTDRESADKSLREAVAKYRRLMKNAPLGIAGCDSNGIITECNSRFAQALGLEPKAICVGTDLFSLKPLKKDGFTKALRACLESASECVQEIQTVNAAGDHPASRAYFSAVRGKDGDVIGAHILVESAVPV